MIWWRQNLCWFTRRVCLLVMDWVWSCSDCCMIDGDYSETKRDWGWSDFGWLLLCRIGCLPSRHLATRRIAIGLWRVLPPDCLGSSCRNCWISPNALTKIQLTSFGRCYYIVSKISIMLFAFISFKPILQDDGLVECWEGESSELVKFNW